MKKICAVVLLLSMMVSSLPCFADAMTPERINGLVETQRADYGIKIDTTGFEASGKCRNNNAKVLIDGYYGVGQKKSSTDNSVIVDGQTAAMKFDERWMPGNNDYGNADIKGLGNPITIEFNRDVTLDSVKWTEGYDQIKKYTLDFYDGNDLVGTFPITTDSQGNETTFRLHLRTANLGQAVTADRMVFTLNEVWGNQSISITEIEFYRKDAAATLDASNESINSILDGYGMVGTDALGEGVPDGTLIESGVTEIDAATQSKNRWRSAKGEKPVITVAFSDDITFDILKWTEENKQIKALVLKCYNDGEEVYSTEKTFNDCIFDNRVYLRTVNLGESVTIDKMVFEVTEIADTNKVLGITEMEFHNILSENGVIDISAECGGSDVSAALSNAFDNNPETTYSKSGLTGNVEIKFDYLKPVFADALYIDSDDISELKLYGSFDGEKYFEIEANENSGIYSFSDEYLQSVKVVVTPKADSLNVSDMGLGRDSIDNDFEIMEDFFKGIDTSYITDEDLSKLTYIKDLPDSFGNFSIIWSSSDDNIINTATGEINRSFFSQSVILYAQFWRDNAVYKTNTYDVIVQENDMLKDNKFNYPSANIRQSAPSVNGADCLEIADRDIATYAEVSQNSSILLDLGMVMGVDTAKWISNDSFDMCDIELSVDGEHWNRINNCTISDDFNAAGIKQVNFDYRFVRFIKIHFGSLSNTAKIYEIYIMSDADKDEPAEQLAAMLEKGETNLITDESLSELNADSINLPAEIANCVIEWDLSKASMIDKDGKVTHTDDDLTGTIGVKVFDRDTDFLIYSHSFKAVSIAKPDLNLYYEALNRNDVSGNFDFDRPDGFLFNQGSVIVDFSMPDSGETLLKSDDVLFKVKTVGNKITINYKNNTETITFNNTGIKVRTVLNDTGFNMYIDYDGTGYKRVVKNGGYLNGFSNGVKTITNGKSLKDVKLYILKSNIGTFLNQFSYSNVSSESMYEITKNVTLMKEIIGLPMVWSSSDTDAINPDTGAVNLSAEPGYVILSAKVSKGDLVEWNKDFYLCINMPNIASEGVVSVDAIKTGNNVITNIFDADMDTSFLTTAKTGYNIKITYPQERIFSRVALIEDTSKHKINAFEIYIDNTLVFSGDSLDGFKECMIDGVYGKEVRISVKATEGTTGFREISVHSGLTKEQKCSADAASPNFLSSYASGSYSMPSVGTYGSTLTYSSNNSVVSFDNSTMVVNNTGLDTSVLITVTAAKDGTSVTKTYSIVAIGDKKVSHNGGSSGGSNGSGSRPNFTPLPAGEVVAPIQRPSDSKDEFTGHWAENQLRSLVSKGIVQGDGNTYNLSGTVTRAEFITMLLRANNVEMSANDVVFDDVSADDWYASAMQTAYKIGWIEGYENNAAPLRHITREEMVKIVCAALGLNPSTDINTDFADKEEQSGWAAGYINSLYSKNIIKGYEDGTFRPKNVLRRDEAMVVIYRILETEVR